MNVPMHILVRHKVVGRLLIHSHNSRKAATESTVNVMFDDRREDRAYAVSFCSLLGRACQSGASQIFMRMQQLDWFSLSECFKDSSKFSTSIWEPVNMYGLFRGVDGVSTIRLRCQVFEKSRGWLVLIQVVETQSPAYWWCLASTIEWNVWFYFANLLCCLTHPFPWKQQLGEDSSIAHEHAKLLFHQSVGEVLWGYS